jgi:hypothetical protein
MLLISGQTPLTNRSWQKDKKKNNSGKHTSMCNTMSHHRTNNFVEKSRVSDYYDDVPDSLIHKVSTQHT